MLKTLETCFLALFAHHADAVTLYDADGHIAVQNAASERLRTMASWDKVVESAAFQETLAEAYRGKQGAFELAVPSSEGELRLRVDIAPVIYEGNVLGVSEIARDQRVRLAEEEREQLNADFPSRLVFYDRVGQLLLAMRRDGRLFALHTLTLQTQKILAPDLRQQLEQAFLHRLRQVFRAHDTVTCIGADFVVIQPEINDLLEIQALVRRVMMLLQAPIQLDREVYEVSVMIGSAIASRRTMSVDDLLAEAELALSRQRIALEK